jgi:hypothetical protein
MLSASVKVLGFAQWQAKGLLADHVPVLDSWRLPRNLGHAIP